MGDTSLNGDKLLKVGQQVAGREGMAVGQPPADEAQHGTGVEVGGHLGIHLRGERAEPGLGEQAGQLLGGTVLQNVDLYVGSAGDAGQVQLPVGVKEVKDIPGRREQVS